MTEVAKKVKVSYPPEAPITLDWMKNKLEAVGQEMASIKTRKSQAAQAIMSNRVSGKIKLISHNKNNFHFHVCCEIREIPCYVSFEKPALHTSFGSSILSLYAL